MPLYVYRCEACGEEEDVTHGFNDTPTLSCLACAAAPLVKVLGRGMFIGAGALPNKRHGVRAADQRESEWNRDLPAYKRMRDAGLQPPSTQGAERLERSDPSDQFDIDYQATMKRHNASRAQVEDTKAALTEAGAIKDIP
jgi:putative FmdB family regulatory protein